MRLNFPTTLNSLKRGRFLLLASLLGGGCAAAPQKTVSQRFPLDGISKVVFRAANAGTAVVTHDAPANTVELSGRPIGGAEGYHPADPAWRETPPERWGLDFAARRHGAVLVISTKNEIDYIHHHYALDALHVRVPTGAEVVCQERTLNGDGAPDLSAPSL